MKNNDHVGHILTFFCKTILARLPETLSSYSLFNTNGAVQP